MENPNYFVSGYGIPNSNLSPLCSHLPDVEDIEQCLAGFHLSSPSVSGRIGGFGSPYNNFVNESATTSNGYHPPYSQSDDLINYSYRNSMNVSNHRNHNFASSSNSYPFGRRTNTVKRRIYESNEEEFNTIFSYLIDYVDGWSFHPNGYIIIIALIEKSSIEQMSLILQKLTNSEFVEVCIDDHGSPVVQKLLECLNSEIQINFVIWHLTANAFQLATNSNGNRVIQSCMTHLPYRYSEVLLKEIAKNCAELARDKYGCCILQQIIRYSSDELTCQVVSGLINDALQLANDLYGNYVLQFVLEMNNPVFTQCLIGSLQGYFMDLSFGKSGSHVVQKCLAKSSPAQAETILKELIFDPSISLLLVDACGNYVVQSAWTSSRGYLRMELQRLIHIHYPIMCSNKFGQKVLQFVEGRRRSRNRRM